MSYRYIGSKARLVPTIIEKIMEISHGDTSKTISDLMSGTGIVSNALKLTGYKVIANDVMTYSYYHNYTSLIVNSYPKFEKLSFLKRSDKQDYSQVIDYLNSIDGIEGYFFKEFSQGGSPANGVQPRNYFDIDDAKKIDAIRLQLIDWKTNSLISSDEHAILLNDLILATNDIANIAGTYGHFLSSSTSNRKGFKLKPTNFNFFNSGTQHQVFTGYAEDISKKIHSDICYIDPPYIKRQYAANYHVLETLAREDFPEAVGVSGLRPWRDQYSNLCTKTKGLAAFNTIFSNLDASEILVSYSDEGLFSKDELYADFRQFGIVTVDEIEYKRFKSHRGKEKPTVTEYIFHIHRGLSLIHI